MKIEVGAVGQTRKSSQPGQADKHTRTRSETQAQELWQSRRNIGTPESGECQEPNEETRRSRKVCCVCDRKSHRVRERERGKMRERGWNKKEREGRRMLENVELAV